MDFFKENGTAYIVMSYVEGITLKEFITSRGGKLPLDAVLNIMLPVMKALEQVHSSGILHRDISPDNIYITRNFNVKLLDFGAARFAMGEHSKSMSVLLKPGYAPVEQYRSKGKQGPWTDIYAVAATMYKALTGNTPPESLDRMYEDVLAAPSKCDVDIPSNIEEALLKAMSIREEQRFQTVSEFSDCLQNRALSGIDDRKATDPAKLLNVSSQPVQSVQAQTSSDLKQEKDELTQKTQQPAKIVCENCGMRNPSYIPSCLSCGKSLKGEKKIIASSMTFEPIKEKKERNILEMLGSIQDNKQYKICGKCSFKNPPSRHYCSNCSASLK
ncbi:MAG TPA: serine/threonine-protein kinase [Clostridia bacterium]|nr:serine/threonine-protein kinase [Clostridia bacterium]